MEYITLNQLGIYHLNHNSDSICNEITFKLKESFIDESGDRHFTIQWGGDAMKNPDGYSILFTENMIEKSIEV